VCLPLNSIRDSQGGPRDRWPNVEVIEADAVTTPLPRDPFRVVANLPFDRTGDLLQHLLDDPQTPLPRADLVDQWGVALKRGVPYPSTARSVVWGATYEAAIARRLPPCAFRPEPTVTAGVLIFRRREPPLIAPEHISAYRRFIYHSFRHGLRSIVPARTVPRELDAHQWAELWHRHQPGELRRSRRSSGGIVPG
jgi:16S rRNA A1518/A1519 N6-dimethyltransferase RsmA/KsgA/DIM1 with predicted DNA glycosylase/AP lyase activity